jgi:rSAM/selenodomain-associated transferase 1
MKPETTGEVGTPLMVGDRIALATMAKVPVPGAVKTRLCPPLEPAEAATLARCFLQDRLEQLAALPVGEPMVAFTPQERAEELQSLLPTGVRLIPQAGEDLGARLDRLLTDLLGEGYAGAIAVDADSPTLPSVYLEEACRQLLAGGIDVVVGPSEDGGYYLIGLRRPAPGLFRAMPWSTSAVLAETMARAREARLRVSLLPTWFDIDRGPDLERLRGPAEPEAFRPPRTLAFLATWAGRHP